MKGYSFQTNNDMYIHDIFSGWLFVNYQLKYAKLKQGVKTHMNGTILGIIELMRRL